MFQAIINDVLRGSMNGKPMHYPTFSKEESTNILAPSCGLASRLKSCVPKIRSLIPGTQKKLYVLTSVRYRVLEWAHSSHLLCNPGVTQGGGAAPTLLVANNEGGLTLICISLPRLCLQ
ncbi:uncharacterized protein LOC144087033 isoform X1 [Stigmatopora argus]